MPATSRMCAKASESAFGLVPRKVQAHARSKLHDSLALMRLEGWGEVPEISFVSTTCATEKAVVRCTSAVTVCR